MAQLGRNGRLRFIDRVGYSVTHATLLDDFNILYECCDFAKDAPQATTLAIYFNQLHSPPWQKLVA